MCDIPLHFPASCLDFVLANYDKFWRKTIRDSPFVFPDGVHFLFIVLFSHLACKAALR